MKHNKAAALKGLALLACLCLAATVLALPAAAGEEAGGTYAQRLAKAREKYNSETVNVYRRGYGWDRRGKINVCFYYSAKEKYTAINIRESLQITDEAEMEAVLEVVAGNENYDEGEYGSISFIKAQWIAHNYAHSLATGNKEGQQMIESLVGESIPKIIGRSKQLDVSPVWTLTDQERMLYEIIELFWGMGRK